MRARAAILLALILVPAGCRMDDQERRQVIESARTSHRSVAASQLVRELRSDDDSLALIYSRPTSLSAPSATEADRPWAPFGRAAADSAQMRRSLRLP